MNREQTIIKVSIQGIIMNLILVLFKAVIGLMTNSIAIILDAVNNLSDAVSQVVTIIATRFAAKEPDKQHPYGYGRIEYLSSVVIAAMVLLAGITSLKESILKVIYPEPAEYTVPSLVIIAVAVVVKFVFGRYVKGVGEKIQSQSLIAFGTDAFMDSVLSFSTLVAALISFLAHIGLEGILGVVLSLFIIRAGLEILMDTLGSIIGDRTDSELSLELKKRISQYEGVNGAYDLILHDYGPSRSIGSVHIEVDDTMDAAAIDAISRQIIEDILEEYGILLTVGIYAFNRDNEEIQKMREKIGEIVKNQEYAKNFHGFYVDFDKKKMAFDTLISFKAGSAKEVAEGIRDKVREVYPDYTIQINIDHDFSD